MIPELMTRSSRFVRVQSYGGSTLSISVPREYAQQMQIEKGSNVRTWIEDGVFHAERTKE